MTKVLAKEQTRTLIDEMAGRVTPHDENTLSWREQEFLRMGFDVRDCLALAKTRIDLHDMQDLLDRGCPQHLAWAILVGTCFFGDDDFDYNPKDEVIEDDDDGA